jgi:Zn-dependent M28 family amino/carboxypeptidase
MKKQVFLIFIVIFGCNPKPECNYTLQEQSDSLRIEQHLKTITKTEDSRDSKNIPLLNQTAEYIFSIFSQYADTTYYQPFQVYGETYMNIVCRLGSANDKPLVVIGAHYDTVSNTEGADDNASGVVGLLELVRILSKEKLNYPIEVVAYTLEEIFLHTNYSGSFVHAKSLRDTGTPVYGMVTFEMIGYFDDRPKSQSYPVKTLKVIYGSKGNYIMLAKKIGSGAFVRNFSNSFKKRATIKTKSMKAPLKWGVDRSDHSSYWKFGYDALMITNTANYRNPNYHKESDTMETLDIPRMMKVIDTTALAIINLK